MNKILIDNNEHILNSYNGQVLFNVNKCRLTFNGINHLFVNNFDNIDLELILNDEAKVNITFLNLDKKSDCQINITQKNKTYLELYDVFASSVFLTESIIDNIMGNNNDTIIKIHCVSNKDKINILEQVNAYQSTKDNVATEEVKGLCSGGKIRVLPNMEISTSDVVANHFVTISSYDKDELFYLMSKGLKENDAKNLLKKGILYGIINPVYRKEFIDE
jgi:hypothetical protein